MATDNKYEFTEATKVTHTIIGCHGTFTTDENGTVTDRRPCAPSHNCDWCADFGKFITRFDLSEWRTYWHCAAADNVIDILDVGYWYGDARYEPPEYDWREEYKHPMGKAK